MYSLETIKQMNAEATRAAKQKRRRPLVLTREKILHWDFQFQSFGDYVPPGWKLKEELFCDSSGCGSSHEPALTQEQLKTKLMQLFEENPTYGYAVVGSGQFQVYLGVFERIPDADA
jgi:hypothetical protein